MHTKTLLLGAIVAGVMSFSVGLVGQALNDEITVTLPHPVTVGEKVLEPGQYEMRRESASATDKVFRIYNDDKMMFETSANTIPTEANKTPNDTKVILHHIGNAYYLDKIWIQGKDYGFEFILPERVRDLKRELEVSVPARYEATQVAAAPTTTNQQAEAERRAEMERQAAADRAAQAERERQAALAESEQRAAAERERQAQFERDRQAQERERQQVAALQQERTTPPAVDSRPAPQVTEREELPATASNWLSYVLAGAFFLVLSLMLRPQTSHE